MRKPSAAGVFACGSAIDGLRVERLEPEVTIDAEQTDKYPEDFHQQSRKIEIVKQRDDDQACANGVENRVSEPGAAEFVQLQHQISDHQHDHTYISDEI